MRRPIRTIKIRKMNSNKTIITIILLNTIQIGAAVGVVLNNYLNRVNASIGLGPYGAFLVLIIIITIVINSLITIRDVNMMIKNEEEYSMVKASHEQVEKLNNTLRGQRHDFMNHLQVVYGLMDMEEYGEAVDYIQKIFNDIQRVSNILKTANPAVNALLQAKLLFCEKRSISLEFYITSRLDNLNVPSWEFCRVMGNIIDNSIYALGQKVEDRKIELYIYEDLKSYSFKIKNNGPAIPENALTKIFEPGFTTKGDLGEGMGLAISKEILETYGGGIKVTSNDKETIFTGWVLK
jgi:two-component system, LytTR family, sensor histidine kinase AgrC